MDTQVSTPQLSSPKLSASPVVASTSVKPADTSMLTPLDPTPVASSSASPAEQRIAKLERDLEISQARNEHLQRSLADARRSSRDAEQLLLRLQWDPKDDYYVYRNPTKANSSDAKYLDKQEEKVKAMLDQMRVMQHTIEELQAENDDLKHKDDDEEEEDAEVDAQGEEKIEGSPAVNSPFAKKQRVKSPLAGSATSSWSRSPSASPAVASPNPAGKSPRFWLFRKLTPQNSPSFWRGHSAPEHSLDSPVASPALGRPTLTRGRPSASDLEVGTAPMSPAHDVASPAISAYSSKPVALRQAA